MQRRAAGDQIPKRPVGDEVGVEVKRTVLEDAVLQRPVNEPDNALGHPGRPEEIVTAALFLASPASSFTSGALVRVDGGDPVGQ